MKGSRPKSYGDILDRETIYADAKSQCNAMGAIRSLCRWLPYFDMMYFSGYDTGVYSYGNKDEDKSKNYGSSKDEDKMSIGKTDDAKSIERMQQ